MRKCDNCEHYFGESCIHEAIDQMDKEWATFDGDLWSEEETPSWCPLGKEQNNEIN